MKKITMTIIGYLFFPLGFFGSPHSSTLFFGQISKMHFKVQTMKMKQHLSKKEKERDQITRRK